ncbi:AraC family transcriptional regulator [Marinobacter sp. NFXS9]|uniref:AraC family transcriptional regulator n=1 Tax=Marinobacter sp. NFXS9 TaxID=2818433 RepID=UPI0032DECEAD
MIDPLAEVVSLLRPSARYSKLVSGAGQWRIKRSDGGRPFYCIVLDGGAYFSVNGYEPIELQPGDFVLVPAVDRIDMSSLEPPHQNSEMQPVAIGAGEFRVGLQDAPPDLRMVVGHCDFESPDVALLVSLLPRFIHIRGEHRLGTLVKLVGDESRAQRPAREEVLSRLLEVLLIEALRCTTGTSASPGLVLGLADVRIANAIRAIHERPAHAWTVAELSQEAALSRSAFFERFNRTVGIPPKAYLLAWRMALAKQLLKQSQVRIADVAEHVGYNSASTFSVAFSRHVGTPPSEYASTQGGEHAAVTEPVG